MLADPANFLALHLRWLVLSVVILAGAGGWYYTVAQSTDRWPGGGSTVGLVLGIVAAALILFEVALWPRKTRRFRSVRWLGSAQLWMKAHIWLGLWVAPLALMHSGFSFGGAFTSILMWVLTIVIASGVLGLVAQNVVPRWLLDHVAGETVFSQIDLVKRQYAEEAAQVVELSCGRPAPAVPESPDPAVRGSPDPAVRGSPDPAQPPDRRSPIWRNWSAGEETFGPFSRRGLETRAERDAIAPVVGAQRRVGLILDRTPEGIASAQAIAEPQVLLQAYEQVLRPFLEGTERRGHHLANRRRSDEYFAVLRKSAGSDAEATLDTLENLCRLSRDLELQRRLHYFLHGWLAVHLPLSIGLLVLLGAHIVYALRFG